MLTIGKFQNLDYEIKYKLWGKYFGFPECCIDYFIENAGGEKWQRHLLAFREKFPTLDGTGYVCCPDCIKTKTSRKLKASITKNRLCPVKFPDTLEYEDDVKVLVDCVNKGELK